MYSQVSVFTDVSDNRNQDLLGSGSVKTNKETILKMQAELFVNAILKYAAFRALARFYINTVLLKYIHKIGVFNQRCSI